MGSLLKIDRDLEAAVEQGRTEWEDRLPLFRVTEYGLEQGAVAPVKENYVRLVPGEQDNFWNKAEKLVLQALADYAASAAASDTTRRRLFADDAARGFAFADLVANRFDVLLMNPPFGIGSIAAKDEFEKAYPKTKSDVYAAFVERGIQLLNPRGRLRDQLAHRVFSFDLSALARGHTSCEDGSDRFCGSWIRGTRQRDGRNSRLLPRSASMTIFVRLLDIPVDAKAVALRDGLSLGGPHTFDVDPAIFSKIPTSPFAYWALPSAFKIFSRHETVNSEGRVVASTNPLNADFRYVREWWEWRSSDLNKKWFPWAKGGSFSKFFYDIDTVIIWSQERRSYTGFLGTENRPLERPASLQHFFRPGLTWPRRTNGLSFRVMPAGCIFADKGPAIFVNDDDGDSLLALCGVVNSRAFAYFVSLQLARTELAQSFEVGLIQQTPMPNLKRGDLDLLIGLGQRAWSLKRALDMVRLPRIGGHLC
jgi:hypothetical protein